MRGTRVADIVAKIKLDFSVARFYISRHKEHHIYDPSIKSQDEESTCIYVTAGNK